MSSKKRPRGTKRPNVDKPVAQPANNSDPVPPVKWRWSVTVLSLIGLSLVVLFLSWIRFFDIVGLDRRMREILISYADSTITKKSHGSVRTILIAKGKENKDSEAPFGKSTPSHRKAHAILTRKLSEVGKAKVIVFDMHFFADMPEVDNDFKKAIEDAEKAGTKIVFGAFLLDGDYSPTFSKTLEPAIGTSWGISDGEQKGKSDLRYVRMASEKTDATYGGVQEESVNPSIALQAATKWRYRQQQVSYWFAPLAGEVRLRDATDGRLLEAIPVNDQMYLLVEVTDRAGNASESYEQVYDHFDSYKNHYENKIVVIGYQEGDDQLVRNGTTYYGAELHASAISMLLKENYIRPLPLFLHYLAIIALIAIAAYLQIKCSGLMCHKVTISLPIALPAPFDKLNIPTAIVVIFIVYGLAAVIAYKVGHLVFDMSYHFAALLLTYSLFILGRSHFTLK